MLAANATVLLLLVCLWLFTYPASAFQSNHTRPLKGCKLNPYYRPVCGSDNQTYANADLLHCFNRNHLRGRDSEYRH